MNRIIVHIAGCAAIPVILWLAGSYIALDFDLFNWPAQGRAVHGILTLIAMLFWVRMVEDTARSRKWAAEESRIVEEE